ncbi:unnamed protein product, partial [Protopolystoma xenopodis]
MARPSSSGFVGGWSDQMSGKQRDKSRLSTVLSDDAADQADVVGGDVALETARFCSARGEGGPTGQLTPTVAAVARINACLDADDAEATLAALAQPQTRLPGLPDCLLVDTARSDLVGPANVLSDRRVLLAGLYHAELATARADKSADLTHAELTALMDALACLSAVNLAVELADAGALGLALRLPEADWQGAEAVCPDVCLARLRSRRDEKTAAGLSACLTRADVQTVVWQASLSARLLAPDSLSARADAFILRACRQHRQHRQRQCRLPDPTGQSPAAGPVHLGLESSLSASEPTLAHEQTHARHCRTLDRRQANIGRSVDPVPLPVVWWEELHIGGPRPDRPASQSTDPQTADRGLDTHPPPPTDKGPGRTATATQADSHQPTKPLVTRPECRV